MTAAATRAALAALVAGVDETVAHLKRTGHLAGCFQVRGMEAARAALNQTDDAGVAGGAAAKASLLTVGGFMVDGNTADVACAVGDRVVFKVAQQIAAQSDVMEAAGFVAHLSGQCAAWLSNTVGREMAIRLQQAHIDTLRAVAPAAEGRH